MSFLVRKQVEDVAKATLQGHSLLDILKQLKISPLTWYKHLNAHPEDKLIFNTARQALNDNHLHASIYRVESANDKFELDKAIELNKISRWMMERLDPDTYGAKVQVEQNVTISLKNAMAIAASRVDTQVIDITGKTPHVAIENDSQQEMQATDIYGEKVQGGG